MRKINDYIRAWQQAALEASARDDQPQARFCEARAMQLQFIRDRQQP